VGRGDPGRRGASGGFLNRMVRGAAGLFVPRHVAEAEKKGAEKLEARERVRTIEHDFPTPRRRPSYVWRRATRQTLERRKAIRRRRNRIAKMSRRRNRGAKRR
jgi:hypothetical protein